MSVKFEGNFDEQFKKISDKIKGAVEGSVKLSEIFTESFMQNKTEFNSIDEFFEKSPFEINSEEDLSEIDTAELDDFVNLNTEFDSWKSFSETAGQGYALRQLKEQGFNVS